MNLSSYWPVLPAALCLVAVFTLPGASDRASVDEVRANAGRVIEVVTATLTGRTAVPESSSTLAMAKSPASAAGQTVSFYDSSAAAQRDVRSRQLWENRPGASDYANGRGTRLNYGESQRASAQHGRW